MLSPKSAGFRKILHDQNLAGKHGVPANVKNISRISPAVCSHYVSAFQYYARFQALPHLPHSIPSAMWAAFLPLLIFFHTIQTSLHLTSAPVISIERHEPYSQDGWYRLSADMLPDGAAAVSHPLGIRHS